MTRFRPSRRTLAKLVASWAALRGAGAALAADPLDRGIGGTGMAPEEPSDRGIGGTGVIGTIRGFGSIVVNDEHIAYADDAPVTIDGRAARAADLRLGHVVRVLAHAGDAGLATRRIAVTHELIGAVQHVARGHLVVLGQRVVVAGPRGARAWRPGDRVAVSGLRHPDGTIEASRIDASRTGRDRIVGRIEKREDGALAIGALDLDGLPEALVGKRCILEGRLLRRRFVATSARTELAEFVDLGADSYSIESFVARAGTGVVIGDGYVAEAAAAPPSVTDDHVVRAIVSARLTAAGGLQVDAIRIADGSATSGGFGPNVGRPHRPSPGAPPQGHGPPEGMRGGGWGGGPSGRPGGIGDPGAGTPGRPGFGPGPQPH